MEKIKLGIIGYGGMGNWHAKNANRIDNVDIVSAHDIDKQRLADARANGLKAFEERDAFLKDPDINFVLISTPNHLHKDLTIEALQAGKNVICEKPVSLSVKELDEMIQKAEETGKIFTVHQNRRWDRDFLVLQKVIRAGMIGKVYSIESKVYGNNGSIYGWRLKKEFGGGMILDWGVHLLDHFTYMYPEKKIKNVFAQLFSVINSEVDDLFKVEMVFEDGLSIHVQVGTFGLIKQPRFFAYGDLGTLVIDDFSGSSGKMKLLKHRIDDMGRIIIDTPAGPTRTMAPQPEDCFMEKELPQIDSEWSEFYSNLLGVLNGKEELMVTPASVRRTMLVIEAVFESAKTGTAVKLDI